jgi:predicted Zn-dependent protease
MTHHRRFLFCLCLLTGCAAHPKDPAPPTTPSDPRAALDAPPPTAFAASGNEALTLDQIQPAPVLEPATAASTRRDGAAPVEAVRLFAQARIAMLDGNRAAATDLLQKAGALDPESFQLHSLLAELYADANDPRAQQQWEKAASIEPDHLDLQIALGRQWMSRAKFPEAVNRLRLARLTSEYRKDVPAAAEADYLLARGLQEAGYDRAALDCYERLLNRLKNQPLTLHRNPQAAALLAHPGFLALHVAALYEKHHDYANALTVLRSVSAKNGEDFDVQAQIVRDTAASGQKAAALNLATDLVKRFEASKASLSLLHEQAGSDAATTTRLSALHKQNPSDRSVVYALFDSYTAQRRDRDAAELMTAAMRQWPDDLRLIRRQFDSLHARGDLSAAAKLVVEAVARKPDNHVELADLWDQLIRPSARGRLRKPQVDALEVSPAAAGSKLFFASRTARLDRGDVAERDALRKATEFRPVFEPSWRQMHGAIWTTEALPAKQKIDAAAKLADDADKAGDAALAQELRGRALLDQNKAPAAALAFAESVKRGNRAPELYLSFATALHQTQDDNGAHSLLARLIDDRPLCQEAYLSLFELAVAQDQPAQAGRVLSLWLAADPDSSFARRLQAREAFAQRRVTDARKILLDLLEHHDNDPEVLAAAVDFFNQTGQTPQLIETLTRRFDAEHWNFPLGQTLAQLYQQSQKPEDAVRVAGQLKASIAADPDLLYTLSGLYSRLGSDQLSEQTLADVLKLDPAFPGANNDLGYLWIEHGRNPAQAEDLIRKAVSAEPDNPSFLDSLGWVLYKRGKFDEALGHLTKAAEPADQADPVVLDHLGDTLYRLGNRDRAAQNWQQAAKRLAASREEGRDDQKDLRSALLQKQQDLSAGRPVSVAPLLSNGPESRAQP